MLLLVSIVCFAQKKDKPLRGYYDTHLYSVEVGGGIKPGVTDSLKSLYQDSLITITWLYGGTELHFNLKNETEQTLKIIWDDAAFVSQSNESSKIFHKGIKYIDRENSQPPTSVYKGSNLSELIAPTSYTSFTSGQYGGWRSSPLVKVRGGMWMGKMQYDESVVGQKMRVVLPIKTADNTIEYNFIFNTVFVEKENK